MKQETQMSPKTSSHVPISCQATFSILIYMFAAFIIVGTYGFHVKLIPIDSIDSAYFPNNLTLEERYHRLVELSKAHLLHLRSKISATQINATHAPMKLGLNVMQPSLQRTIHNYYISQVFIGSRPYSPHLMVDTGSDLTWVQCDRCVNCFPLRGGNFKYQESSTFHPLSCDHPLCVPRICRQGICHYDVKYPQCSTKGWLSQDTFIFSGGTRTSERFPIVFGCGFDNRNISFGDDVGPNNVIAGIFGLGNGPQSIVRQLRQHTGMRFSYCLPSWKEPNRTYTYIHFGNNANFRGDLSRRVQSTRMVQGRSALYYVNMLGISVEGRRININPGVFRLNPNGTGGFALDSGSPQTYLAESAYRILKEELVQHFRRRYGWQPMRNYRVKLCYTHPPRGRNYPLPSITFHFEGANFNIGPDNLFFSYANGLCMLIMPLDHGDEPSVLGAFQQANHRFLFDVGARRLSFAPDHCSYN